MQSGTRAPATGWPAAILRRLRTRPGVCVIAVSVAALLWLALRPLVTTRELTLDLSVEDAGQRFSLEWVRARGKLRNGVWLDRPGPAVTTQPTWLEIRPSGASHSGSGGYEFCLFSVLPANGAAAPLNLQQLLANAGPDEVTGRWEAYPGPEGIVYRGPGPGRLRVRAPAGGLEVRMARQDIGGKVALSYGGDARTLNLYGMTYEIVATVLYDQTEHPQPRQLSIAQPIPNYDLAVLELCWQVPAQADVGISQPSLRESVFGLESGRSELTPHDRAGAVGRTEQSGRTHFASTAAVGSIVLARNMHVSTAGNVLGFGVSLAGLVVLATLGRVGKSCLRVVLAALRFELAAALLIVGARIWVTQWAPAFYIWDSFDYLENAQKFATTGSLAHFGALRMPGFSLLLAALLPTATYLSLVLGCLHALLGVGTAFLVYSLLKPHLPRPWPAVGLLLVGLDPLALFYERYVLTECLATFLVTLDCWLVAKCCACAQTRPGSLRTSLLWAAAAGVCSAMGFYVRSSLLTLVVLGPLGLLLGILLARRRPLALLLPAAAALCAVALLAPWTHGRGQLERRMEDETGGKRLESLVVARELDLNQTALYSHARWNRRKIANTDYWCLRADIEQAQAAASTGHLIDRTVEEMLARRPYVGLGLVGQAAGYLSGLLVHREPQPCFGENGALARWLLGLGDSVTNFDINAKDTAGYAQIRAKLPQLEVNTTYLRTSPSAVWFDRLYQAYQFVRPPVALLFLVGAACAVRARRTDLIAVALVVVGNIAALSCLMTLNDRYGVPFRSLLTAIAVYGAYTAWAAFRPSPPTAPAI